MNGLGLEDQNKLDQAKKLVQVKQRITENYLKIPMYAR